MTRHSLPTESTDRSLELTILAFPLSKTDRKTRHASSLLNEAGKAGALRLTNKEGKIYTGVHYSGHHQTRTRNEGVCVIRPQDVQVGGTKKESKSCPAFPSHKKSLHSQHRPSSWCRFSTTSVDVGKLKNSQAPPPSKCQSTKLHGQSAAHFHHLCLLVPTKVRAAEESNLVSCLNGLTQTPLEPVHNVRYLRV